MSAYQVRVLNCRQELLDHAAAYNDLWQRAEVAIPTLRAEHLADWLDTFARHAKLRIVLIERDGHAVAALPVVGRKIKGLVEMGSVPTNGWTAAGELLYDPLHDAGEVMPLLADALRELPWPLLYLQPVAYHTPAWQALLAAFDAADVPHETRLNYRIGTVEFPRTWQRYQEGWSSKHRRNMKRGWQGLCQLGPTHCEDHDRLPPTDVADLLNEAFAIEDRSWKHGDGGSVLQNPAAHHYYLRQAEQMAEQDRLRVSFLVHNGQRIAFTYGWFAKGTFFLPKFGYDQAFAKHSPGQLIMRHVLKRQCGQHPQPLFDMHGDTTPAIGKWVTDSYQTGTVAIPLKPLVGGVMLKAFQLVHQHSDSEELATVS